MKAATFSSHIFRELSQIRDNQELDPAGKIMACRHLLLRLFELATEEDKLHFSTVYARIAYLAHRYNFPGRLVFQLHRFRLGRVDNISAEQLPDTLLTGYKVAIEANQKIFQQALPEEWLAINETPYPLDYREPDVIGFHPSLRVVALEVLADDDLLIVREEEQPVGTWRIYYGVNNANELIRQSIQLIQRITGLPVILNLLQVEVHQNRLLVPKQIVIEPDYLIDVTAVAYCYDALSRPQAWGSLSRKLLPYEMRPALLKGNIVNLFLDVLINDPDTDFLTLVQRIFQSQPLALCCLTDGEVKSLVQELKGHYAVLKQTVHQGLIDIGIDREACQLEPSFYSPITGLQGRLDLLYHGQTDKGKPTTSIVELKSGKIWAPNKYGLNRSHFIQTLLYDLMINAAYGKGANVAAYILYSQTYERPLRYAPPERFTQQEAIGVRNQILAIEMLLCRVGLSTSDDILTQTNRLIGKLNVNNFPKLSKFTEQDFTRITKAYQQLDEVERRYLGAFLGFNAREQRLAKTGEQGAENLNGLASLWLDDPAVKQDRFEMLAGLTLTHYDETQGLITFKRPQTEEQLVKFRTGDIVVLFGTQRAAAERGEVIRSQVFKSTLISLDAQQLQLRLRSRQLNDRVFRQQQYWSIERDVLDSSFSNHYRGLWAWAENPPERRALWLGLQAPRQGVQPDLAPQGSMTQEQTRIMAKLLAAPDYFLLWGPPGTGKTSFMLHYLVDYLLHQTTENILLVAYTNRAVDEICESIERINAGNFRDYLRIGSRYGTSPAYQQRLLSVRSEAFTKRAELTQLIEQTRVFVGTVASVGGKEELFKLKSFDRIIIDEASQILEPLLLGLLSRIPRAVLIGDHRQLPAVVQQSETEAAVYDTQLREIGLHSLGTSLFERLYLKAQVAGWDWAYDQLRYQGRMHQDVMAFPAANFYGGSLQILPAEVLLRQRQLQPLNLQVPKVDNGSASLLAQLARYRLLFFPTAVDQQSTDRKTNRHEAAMLARLIEGFEALYTANDQALQIGDIGIITPYRAQIAKVRRTLIDANRDPDAYTIDTVERYQGGARRIILLSLCTNDISQMATLAQTSTENIDRKLNVAMTRAR
ncbi:MAG: AAA domain-containing protein, partial [Bacteroidota bacterium]